MSKSFGTLGTRSDCQTRKALVLYTAVELETDGKIGDHLLLLFEKCHFRMMVTLVPAFETVLMQLALMVSYLNIHRTDDQISRSADSSVWSHHI